MPFYIILKQHLYYIKTAFILCLCKRTPFRLQKDSFCLLKGLLLQCKCSPFATQKDPFSI